MPSRPETIEKAQLANELKQQRVPPKQIADKLGVSEKLITEYLTPNAHGPTCPTCGGKGVSKNRTTGELRPICDRD